MILLSLAMGLGLLVGTYSWLTRDPGEQIEVTAKLGNEQIWITSHSSNSIMARTHTWLYLDDGLGLKSTELDDDVAVSQMRLVQDGDWILAINGNLVLGGFHKDEKVLFGDHEWENLPYTLWDGGGKILATGSKSRYSDDVDRAAGFEERGRK